MYTCTIPDGHGGTVDQTVTITVTGTNEAPTITAADAKIGRAAGRERAKMSTTGSTTNNDGDLIDTHTTNVTEDASNTMGDTMTMGAVSESATTEPGTVGWTYSVADNHADYRTRGQ